MCNNSCHRDVSSAPIWGYSYRLQNLIAPQNRDKPPRSGNAARVKHSPPQFLIVDDDGESLAQLGQGLLEWGYCVATACDGMEAVHAIRTNPEIEIAILNWMMPGLGGMQAGQTIKQISPNTRVFVTVGEAFRDELTKRFPSWAEGYIAKPVNWEALKNLLPTLAMSA